jgi:hypothetical protein
MTDENPYRSASSEDLKSIRMPKGRPKTWPFADMEIGGTITVIDPSRFHSARSSATRVARITGKKFKTATMTNGTLLVRRIA